MNVRITPLHHCSQAYQILLDNQMDQDLVVRLNQAAIDGIRSTGAKQ